MKPIPVPSEEAESPGTHAISLQDIHTPGPVKGVLSLVQAQEDHMRDLLHNGYNLLNQFDLESGVPRLAVITLYIDNFLFKKFIMSFIVTT